MEQIQAPTPSPVVLPETGYIRLKDLLKFIPVSKSTIWNGVKAGSFPKPVKLSPRVTAWHVDDVRSYINRFISSE